MARAREVQLENDVENDPVRPTVSWEDAISFIDQVKACHNNDRAVYTEFLKTLSEFRNEKIDRMEVIIKTCRLFRRTPQLIIGLNQFLPPGFNVSIRGNEYRIKTPTAERRLYEDQQVVPDVTDD